LGPPVRMTATPLGKYRSTVSQSTGAGIPVGFALGHANGLAVARRSANGTGWFGIRKAVVPPGPITCGARDGSPGTTTVIGPGEKAWRRASAAGGKAARQYGRSHPAACTGSVRSGGLRFSAHSRAQASSLAASHASPNTVSVTYAISSPASSASTASRTYRSKGPKPKSTIRNSRPRAASAQPIIHDPVRLARIVRPVSVSAGLQIVQPRQLGPEI
jgi:hypothetical protein